MKYTLSFALILGFCSLVQAQQQLSNPGMESWTTRPNAWEEPASWYSLNILKQYSYPATSVKTTDKHSGNYALLLESKAGSFSDIPGLLCSNFMFDKNMNPDFNLNFIPFSSRPYAATFWYKSYLVAGGDSITFFMLLTKWNSSTGKKDTIGLASWFAPGTVNSYTQAVVPVTYYSSQTPDSASILFSTTVNPFTPTLGNQLYVDDIFLSYSTGLSDLPANKDVQAWPNPVSSMLHVEATEAVQLATVYSMDGKQLLQLGAQDAIFDLDCSGLLPGMYILNLRMRSGGTQTIKINR